jgi:type IV secretory pathway TrbF-like protein
MWEVSAAEGRLDELIAFVLATADPSAHVYRSAGPVPRVVVIDPTGQGIAEVPADLIARPAHSWEFEPIAR